MKTPRTRPDPRPERHPAPDAPRGAVPVGPLPQEGFALVTVLLILILLSGLTVTAHLMSRAEVQIGGNDYTATRAFYAAEAGAEAMLGTIRDKMADGVLTATEVDETDDDPPDIPGFDLETYRAEMQGGTEVVEITQGPFSGLKSLSQKLLLTSSVEGASGARTTVELNADALAIPIFQFAAFYNEDLEIFPGPVMDLTGRVHTNENLYLDSENELRLHDVVTASGHFHMHRKHDPSVTEPGDVEIQLNDDSWHTIDQDNDVHGFCSDDDPDPDCTDSQAEDFVDFSKGNWDNNVQTKAHGVEPLRLPVPEGTDPYKLIAPCDEIAEPAMADIAYGCPGNYDVLVEVEGTSLTVDDGGLGWDGGEVWFAENQFYDDREQDDSDDGGSTWAEVNERSNRDVIELDVSEIADDEYDTSAGGGGTIVYVTAEGAGASLDQQQYVLRVRDGEELHHPLTIATDLPLYVLGDYNDEVSADWQPSSLVSDNITFLSECWDDSDSDSRSNEEGGAEGACSTTVQAAVMTGHTPTSGPAAASAEEGGQFENFPRFLENWGGDTMEINGSFVSMWFDRFSDSKWQWCCSGYSEDYYSPPVRDWRFDERFRDPSRLPPGTPVVGQILRIGFIRTY